MQPMSPITTHVLDTALGKPANGVQVTLEINSNAEWRKLGSGTTNADGRLASLLPDNHKLASGLYRITFATGRYFEESKQKGFYPEVSIQFSVENAAQHYHVPLLLNPFGYSTYRGS